MDVSLIRLWYIFNSDFLIQLNNEILDNKIHVLNQKVVKEPATFQASLRATLIIGQAFSLIPVQGVFSNKASDVRLEDNACIS